MQTKMTEPSSFESQINGAFQRIQQEGERDLVRDLQVNKDDLEREFLEQPIIYAYWFDVASVLRGQCLKAKQVLKNIEATLDQKYRLEEGKTTETSIKNKVLADPLYNEALTQFNDAKIVGGEEGWEGKAFGVVQALRQKTDMLKALAPLYRREEVLRVYEEEDE